MDLVGRLTLFAVLGCATICRASKCSVQERGRGVWVESLRQLHVGEARLLTAVFCTRDPVWFQLWIRSNDSWMLVWQKRWQPVSTNVVEYLDLQPDEYIEILPNHRLGLAPATAPQSAISIRKSFSSSFAQLISTPETGPYQLNRSYEFEKIQYPGVFIADFCDSTGCPSLEAPTDVSTTTAPVVCKTLPSLGRVILERNRLLETGVVRAIKTHFCHLSPVIVQLWDAIGEASTKYQLIWQKIVRPVLSDGTETIIPLLPKEYINIRRSYRLGLQPASSDVNISVPYKFSAKASGNMVTSSGRSMTLCDELVFDGIPYPWEFLLSFCYDTGCTKHASDSNAAMDILCPNTRDKPTTVKAVTTNSRSPASNAESVKTSAATPVGRHYVPWLVSVGYASYVIASYRLSSIILSL